MNMFASKCDDCGRTTHLPPDSRKACMHCEFVAGMRMLTTAELEAELFRRSAKPPVVCVESAREACEIAPRPRQQGLSALDPLFDWECPECGTVRSMAWCPAPVCFHCQHDEAMTEAEIENRSRRWFAPVSIVPADARSVRGERCECGSRLIASYREAGGRLRCTSCNPKRRQIGRGFPPFERVPREPVDSLRSTADAAASRSRFESLMQSCLQVDAAEVAARVDERAMTAVGEASKLTHTQRFSLYGYVVTITINKPKTDNTP